MLGIEPGPHGSEASMQTIVLCCHPSMDLLWLRSTESKTKIVILKCQYLFEGCRNGITLISFMFYNFCLRKKHYLIKNESLSKAIGWKNVLGSIFVFFVRFPLWGSLLMLAAIFWFSSEAKLKCKQSKLQPNNGSKRKRRRCRTEEITVDFFWLSRWLRRTSF